MLFKKLLFNNYKTFYGNQQIDLYIPKEIRKEQKKNIILIGGLNGAGKTTILKVIHYVLFGKRGISEQEHKRLFSNIINNTYYNEGGRECSVTLTLETDNGEHWELRIKWVFDHFKKMISENRQLTVKKPGIKHGKTSQIENINAYNRFIDKMIPYNAAPFFIFDGEEIKDIILRQSSKEMKESIHKISGMEAYNLLLTDLSAIKISTERELEKSKNQKAIHEINSQLNDIDEKILINEARKTELQLERNKTEGLLNVAKTKRNDILILNSRSREVVINKQIKLTTELDITTKQLDELFKEKAIYIILIKKISDLKNRIKIENGFIQRQVVQNSALVPYQNFINQLLDTPITPPLISEQLLQIKSIGEDIWRKENNIINGDTEYIELIHDLSNSNSSYLLNVPTSDRELIVKLINRIEELKSNITEIEREIRSAPETVGITDENEKIDLLSRKLGEYDLRSRSITNKLNNLKEERIHILSKVTRNTAGVQDYTQLNTRLSNVTSVLKAMKEYVEKVTILKAEYIKEEFADMLIRLFRKQAEFANIEFDINTYTIRLYNDRGQEISIQDRSAGEMQMIASALIWALTKASDLSLPMVIDTPLGRLDSFHRNHLINSYYKELSEQVIILSTDTEVSEEYANMMLEHSYRQYMLDYDETKKYTIIRDGYFNFTITRT